jgi:glycyl-tRNA synthetase alpha chain
MSESFQELIKNLQDYWSDHGCTVLMPYDNSLGAGTFNPATTLYTLSKQNYRCVYIQPSHRPADARFGEHPNRLYKHHQCQVILKPSPVDVQELYLESLKCIGLDYRKHDIRFVEDDWESPTLGAAGVGWEVWCDGMEVTQWTYMQQMGGIEYDVSPVEITYGLERLALYIQKKNNIYDLVYNKSKEGHIVTYGEIFQKAEYEFSKYSLECANTQMLFKHFNDLEQECRDLLKFKIVLPAYEQCIKANHIFNLLEARRVISVTERSGFISRVRAMAKSCCELWKEENR